MSCDAAKVGQTKRERRSAFSTGRDFRRSSDAQKKGSNKEMFCARYLRDVHEEAWSRAVRRGTSQKCADVDKTSKKTMATARVFLPISDAEGQASGQP